MRLFSSAAVVLSSVLFGCAAPSSQNDAPAAAQTQQAKTEQAAEYSGVLVPVDYDAISLWPEAYAGELLVMEVLAHGSTVKQGDVIAKLHMRAIDEQIKSAELEARSAAVNHEGLLERNKIAEESASAQLERTRAELARAQRALDGYMKHEVAFTKRSDDQAQLREAAWMADQQDELEQLEAMYNADELTDATEEIVLKRSRRDLEMTELRNKLSHDRRVYRAEYADDMERERKTEGLQKQEQALAHLIRTQAIEAKAREDAQRRSNATLDKQNLTLARLSRDRERMTVRATRDGVLLHGKAQDYRPGGSPKPLERGSRLTARSDAFLIADPSRLAVALDLTESALVKMSGKQRASVHPVTQPGIELAGAVSIASYPAANKGDEASFEATVSIDDETPGLVIGTHAKVEFK